MSASGQWERSLRTAGAPQAPRGKGNWLQAIRTAVVFLDFGCRILGPLFNVRDPPPPSRRALHKSGLTTGSGAFMASRSSGQEICSMYIISGCQALPERNHQRVFYPFLAGTHRRLGRTEAVGRGARQPKDGA